MRSDPHPKIFVQILCKKKVLRSDRLKPCKSGAEDGARTRDLQFGKLMLYQLSYFRMCQHLEPQGICVSTAKTTSCINSGLTA